MVLQWELVENDVELGKKAVFLVQSILEYILLT